MALPFIARFYATILSANEHIKKTATPERPLYSVQCEEGFLVVSEEVYNKYFKK